MDMTNIVGRLTGDAKVNTVTGNKQVVNFSVAINDSYKNKEGERITQTDYFDCAYWMGTKVAQFLTKGTLVELTGRVTARAWLTGNGEPRAALNFNTSKIQLYGGGKKTENQDNDTADREAAEEKYMDFKVIGAEEVNDDLPF
jgi:single-strand DNA-binding protein